MPYYSNAKCKVVAIRPGCCVMQSLALLENRCRNLLTIKRCYSHSILAILTGISSAMSSNV